MSPDEIIHTLDLGLVEDLAELADRLREVRQGHIASLDAVNPGLPETLMARIRETRLAEIAICEEALTGFGEPFEIDDADGVPL